MAPPREKLAESLTLLNRLQEGDRRVFRSREIARPDRERLLRNGFLQPVMKGWVISARPGEAPGDSTAWYTSFWEFCARYAESRFGPAWHLSPEQSLLLAAESTAVPRQVVVYAPRGTNNAVALPFGTGIYDLKQPQMPPAADLEVVDGLRVHTPAAALLRVPESFFTRHPLEARVVLAGLRDPSDVLRRLLEGGHSAVAGRLAGAFRRIGDDDSAREILGAMRSAGYEVRETDPFEPRRSFGRLSTAAPIVARIQALWESMRAAVLESFPPAPGLAGDAGGYLASVDELYRADAYHSLSIEGYRVTPALVERVRGGGWNPGSDEADRRDRDALAARGYWQAFQAVKGSVAAVLEGGDAGEVARRDHRAWYRELFQPCVAAGLVDAAALAGYRNDAVYLRGSRHVPPRWEAVRDAMPALFDLLSAEEEPAVRAVLGHWLFGYLHPYPDGNGRLARFLMNVMLASGGYPWTIVRVEDRGPYLEALESASVEQDARPFAAFLAERVRRAIAERG
jgi:hypothetical protein